jgi:hypothetical protein
MRYAKWMNFGYGLLSFSLIFLVEGKSILQATLTLNGLVGGILLGLFSLGIFFKSANLKGALFGGLLSSLCVVTLGVLALTFGEDHQSHLESFTHGCNCTVKEVLLDKTEIQLTTNATWYSSICSISYMWYSMIGTLLTIFFGLLISQITQSYDKWNIYRLTSLPKFPKDFPERSPAKSVDVKVFNLTLFEEKCYSNGNTLQVS